MQGVGGGAELAGSLLLRIINVGYLPLVQQAPSPHRAVERQLQLQGQQGTPGRVRRVRVRPGGHPGGQGAGGPPHSKPAMCCTRAMHRPFCSQLPARPGHSDVAGMLSAPPLLQQSHNTASFGCPLWQFSTCPPCRGGSEAPRRSCGARL